MLPGRLSKVEWLLVAGLLFFCACIAIFLRLRGSHFAPRIVCDHPTVNLGVITSDVPINLLFTIQNSGDGVLQISDVKTSCACTVVPFYQKSMRKGESATIPVTVDVKNRHGEILQYVLLTTNDPAHPQFPLRLKADIEIVNPDLILGDK